MLVYIIWAEEKLVRAENKKKKQQNTRGKSEIMSRPVIERFCFCLKSSLENAFYGTTFEPIAYSNRSLESRKIFMVSWLSILVNQ